MALTQPILLSQVAFDSDVEQNILFNVSGGSQVVANRLKVTNNATGIVAYNQLQQSFRFAHVLPANTLTNGTYYVMQIQTVDAQGDVSPWSNSIQFYCFTTPTINITNFPVGNIINNASFSFDAIYEQLQGELLNSYVYFLYNASGTEIASSGVKYVGTAPPNIFTYTFSGFDDNSLYRLQIEGVTVEGTHVFSPMYSFTVDYVSPSLFAILQLENDCSNGWINITSNIVNIEGLSNPSPPIYIDDKKIDLTGDGSWVRWNDGFSINQNFTMGIWGEQFKPNSTIALLWNMEDGNAPYKILINFRQEYAYGESVIKTFAELYCYEGEVYPYYCYSNFITNPSIDEQVFIWVRRINNIYTIQIENRGVIV